MIVPRDQLGPIARGEQTEAHLPPGHPCPQIGTIQAIQGGVGKEATCTVRVLDHWHHHQGGFMVRFQLAAEVPPRLLARSLSRAYTTDPASAVPEEGEAVDPATQRWLTDEAHLRDATRRNQIRVDREALDLERKIVAYQTEARRRHIDIRSELRLLDRMKDDKHVVKVQTLQIRRKLDQAA